MSANASLEELGVIAVELALSNATYINWYISNKLLQEKGFDPYAKACLKDCHELYSDAIPELKDVLDDFKDKDYYKANIELSAAMEASTTCEDGYKERKGEVSPLAKEDNNFFQLCAIALAFTNMLH
uniref:Pectinesterase inhibitor domain-containing protein n=1 Tax=Vitis vinifera TaxID=29760 RepID=F6HTC9_VITVI